MSDVVIRAEGIGKRYRIGERERYSALRDKLAQALLAPWKFFQRAPRETFWALRDVNLEVREGEVLGLIGRNGAGKTTLLKILSRITRPTTGWAEVHGHVGSLLEVGTGFHTELTGRENTFLSGAILGMKKREIERKFDEIVAFAEIEKFIDTPVKHYSSGMFVRLAFAVAAHLEPEVLLVDEVLAVGDVNFQRKCLGKMGEVARQGRTIVLVSHNMAAIESFCQSAVLLDDGRILRHGPADGVIGYYLQTVLPASIEGVSLANRRDRSGSGRIRLTSFHVEDRVGNRLTAARSGMDVVFVFGFKARGGDRPAKVDVGLSIHTEMDRMLTVLYGSYSGQVFDVVPRNGSFRCVVPKLPLAQGRYGVGARVVVGGDEADWPWNGVGYLDVDAGDFYGTGSSGFEGYAPLLLSGTWSVSTLLEAKGESQ